MIKPLGFCVLIKPDPVEKDLKVSSIVIPEDVLDKQRLEVTTGIVVDFGQCAWSGLGDGGKWCEIMDHVIYAKYGGKSVSDPDTGEKFVLIMDKDILARV